MTRHVPLVFAALLCLPIASPQDASAEPIGLIERYALAVDREAVLRELIPGSESYYYLHGLHYQVTGQLDQAEAIINQWGNESPFVGDSGKLQMLRDRQRLLTFRATPDRTIDYLKGRLNIQLDHAAPRKAGERRYPDTLDEALLAFDKLTGDAIRSNQELSPAAYARLVDQLLDQPNQRRDFNAEWLASRIRGRWSSRLGELAIVELRERRDAARAFGDRPIHNLLTLDELKQVFETFPRLRSNDGLISQILTRLRPSDDFDLAQQAEVRLAYLQRVETFAQTLPEAQNSLKASAAYRLLEAHWKQGEFPGDLFLRYLRLPRRSPLLEKNYARGNRFAADLNRDYGGPAMLPPIGNEEPLVRAYLEHFLRDADSTDVFAPFIEENYLRRVFAETKLLSGVGDPQRWYAMLSSDARQTLTERVELTLPPINPQLSTGNDPAALQIDIKNVDELIVRVYQINTTAYYRTHTQAINTDIDLDGLVATAEQRLQFNQPDIQRHRESIDLPGVEGRGVWIVDLLGGGLRARAILRRGDLRITEQRTANGQEFVVLDENRQPVPAARMLVGGQELLANDEGRLVLPPVDRAVQRQAVLLDDQLAVPVSLLQRGESYELRAQMAINRQQLRAGNTAQIVLRTQLSLNQLPVDVGMIENPVLTVTATDLDGVATSKRFENLELSQSNVTVVPFRVPARLHQLEARLSGRITKIAGGREVEVADRQNWEINGIRKTARTNDIHLTRNQHTWVAEVRGLTGEPISGQTVQVRLHTIHSNTPVTTQLETNAAGQIVLGMLPGVREIELAADNAQFTRSLESASAHWPRRLHGTETQTLRLPLAAETHLEDRSLRLLALRGNLFEADLTDAALEIQDNLLQINPLEPGDYLLIQQHRGQFDTLPISITAGPVVTDIAAGEVRHLELRWPNPFSIANVDANDDQLQIQLAGDARMARVHVFGSRYLPEYQSLSLASPVPLMSGIDLAENGYVSDLKLGEEYLYVLRRQYAQKFPGVMLPQPSLLLAPWATEETRNETQSAAAGDAIPQAEAPSNSARMRADGERGQDRRMAPPASQDLAFLPTTGVLLTNLEPNDEGLVTIDADALGEATMFQIVVTDPAHTVTQTVARKLRKPDSRDLRLPASLAADKPFAFERTVLIAGPNNPLEMSSVASAKIQIYSEIGELFQLYQTMSGDSRFSEFVPLGRWHTLDPSAKRELYGRLASHELHVFLKHKDPAFFDEVVRPYLQNKKEKQLVDHWLLGNDLSAWADFYRFETLNAFERAILARVLPEQRDSILRAMREQLDVEPINPDQLRRLVDFGLAGKGLSEEADKNNLFFAENEAMDAAGEGYALGGLLEKNATRMELKGKAAELSDGISPGRGRGAVPATAGAMPAPSAGMGGYGGGGGGREMLRRQAGGRTMLGRQPQFFQRLDATKQWAENHWDQVRVQAADAQLIPLSPFWVDWAQHDDDSAFASQHLLRAAQNRHAALIALALLDLPLQSQELPLPTEDTTQFTPPHPVAVITKRLQPLEPAGDAGALLVGQRFELMTPNPYAQGDARTAPEEFLTGRAYRGQIVLTNPTPQPQTVDCLWQIPAGSLPLSNAQNTDSRTVKIGPFEVQRIEYQFYFPLAGSFTHYPVCVAADGKVLARAEPRTFTVVETPTKLDEASWEQIAQNGTPEQIAAFLESHNLRELQNELPRVAHRMRTRNVYDVVIAALEQARLWQSDLFGYAFLHRDEPRMTTYLEHQRSLVASVGPVFHSDLLEVDPINERFYEHLEYAPLVRARIHPLRDEPEILNDRFLQQYRSLMNVIAHQPAPSADQHMAICYYHLLQNRIGEAVERLANIDRQAIAMRTQYDYLSAYLAMHRADYETAADIAANHRNHPVPRWRTRFAEVADQLRQRRDLLSGSQLVNETPQSDESVREDAADLALMDRERRQSEQAAAAPDVRVRIEGDAVVIDHRHTEAVQIRFYGVDLELLFSKTPFVRQGLEKLAMVQPSSTDAVAITSSTGTARYRLGEDLARQTLLVEVISGAARDTALYYGGRLKTYVSEGFGQLQVSDRNDGEPVATAYVKVYAKDRQGNIQFHKDGYTDLRGRFDYVTLSVDNLDQIERFAILVLDPERGATLHDVAPPTR